MMGAYRKAKTLGVLENKLLAATAMRKIGLPTMGVIYGGFAYTPLGEWPAYDRQVCRVRVAATQRGLPMFTNLNAGLISILTGFRDPGTSTSAYIPRGQPTLATGHAGSPPVNQSCMHLRTYALAYRSCVLYPGFLALSQLRFPSTANMHLPLWHPLGGDTRLTVAPPGWRHTYAVKA